MSDRGLRRLFDASSRYVRRAPGTHIYLLVLLVTTTAVQSLHPVVATALLRQLSTNLTQMGRSAGRVLFLSAFLLDRDEWITQVALFTAVYVPLERWAGTWRWLVVVATGHVTATLITTVGIWADVRSHRGGLALTSTIDVGVSYGFFAAVGFLAFGLRSGWLRAAYVGGFSASLGYGLARHHSFTDAGHAAAAVIGASLFLVLGPGLKTRQPLRLSWARGPTRPLSESTAR